MIVIALRQGVCAITVTVKFDLPAASGSWQPSNFTPAQPLYDVEFGRIHTSANFPLKGITMVTSP
ncbi:MAG TPA: hypothetical protein VMS77_00015 [Conexivisphaerales archaeon]|nr:hypothetical protein [Conexivisphaerales archaeon]